MTESMRALVVGCGSIGRRHAENLLALDGIGHVTVATSRPDCLGALATDPRIVTVSSPEGVACDFAVIANDTNRHVGTAVALLKRGVPVLVEKPLSATVEGVDALIASASGISVGVAYNMRFLGVMPLLTGWLDSGALGTPYFARIEVGQDLAAWRSGRDYRDAYSASRSRGGGVALDLSHEVDYMQLLFGDPTAWDVRIACTGALDTDVEDVFEGLYSFGDRFLCSVHMDYLEQGARRSFALLTSRGRLDCDFIAGTLTATMDLRQHPDPSSFFDMAATYRLEVAAFADAVAGRGVWPGATLADGLRVLELLGSGHDLR
jgi:predicted dehydrogenase